MRTSTFILLYILVLAAPARVGYSQQATGRRSGSVPEKQYEVHRKMVALTDKPLIHSQSIEAAICEGQTYILGGRSLVTGGQYSHCFHTKKGDSLITVNLTVYSHVMTTDFLTLYETQLPASWNDIVIPEGALSNPAFAIYNTYNANGCDSIVTLNLTVLRDSVRENKISPAPDTSHSLKGYNDNINEHINDMPEPGVSARTTIMAEACAGDGYYFENKLYTESGTFTHVFKNGAGADSIVTLQLRMHEAPVVSIIPVVSQHICSDSMTTLMAKGATSYEWQVDDGYTFTGRELKHIPAGEAHQVILTGKDQYGCTGTATLTVNTAQCNSLKMPGSFYPDGYSTTWNVFKPLELTTGNLSMQIYDQWGRRIYYTSNVNDGWSGKHINGTPAAAGLYYYIVQTQHTGRVPFFRRGKVLLLR